MIDGLVARGFLTKPLQGLPPLENLAACLSVLFFVRIAERILSVLTLGVGV